MYLLYEKKVVGNVMMKEELEKEEIRKFICVVFNVLMYVFELILLDDGVKGDGKIVSLLYLICLIIVGVVFNLLKWF